MLGIKLNKEVIDRCVQALTALADIQVSSRRRLVKETQSVCSKCERAYSALLTRLGSVKQAYRSPARLAKELHDLSIDSQTRARFKPEGLCSEIDQLLADFQNNLKGLKYSVHLFSIAEIRDTLQSMGNYDQALYHQYDRFMAELSNLAAAIDSASSSKDRSALVEAVRAAIAKLEADLTDSIKSMRAAKDRVVKVM
jgi:hypothetical protein